MAEFTLEAAPILGTDTEINGNRIVERSDLALVSIATPLGGDDALAAALTSGWSLDPPLPAKSTKSGETRAIQTGADQIMLVFSHPTPDAERVVQAKLNGAGYTTEQTDNWVVLEISGPDTLAALERLSMLDVRNFETDASARTVMEHMGALIVRLDADRFWLMSISSSAGSFLHAIETSYHYVT